MSVLTTPVIEPATTSAAAPRLLRGVVADGGPVDLQAHLSTWGRLDLRRPGLHVLDELDRSGLAGHGGAAFPVGAKWRSVRDARGRPVVVANGAEGEPASAKDATLLTRVPHLVLDGASAAAATLGARRVVLYVPRRFAGDLARVVEERARFRLDPIDVEIVRATDAFLAGQESAVVNALNGRGVAIPSFTGRIPVRTRGVDGGPTLVHNVETLAHVALIARFGASWFRATGTEADPGTALLTVTGRYPRPVVLEAPLGTPLGQVLDLPDDATDTWSGALLGGYGGTWVSLDTLRALELSERSARSRGATLGPGVAVLLATSVCPLAEVARVVRYMHGQAAGQCGPCIHGLDGLDRAMHALAFAPEALAGTTAPIREYCELVDGRGACRHPDGVARFVRSACDVFSVEVSDHLRRGPCRRVTAPSVLPLRGPRPARGRPGRRR